MKKTITEQQGSEIALLEGENHYADLVVWGWYGVTDTGAILQLRLENLNSQIGYPLGIEKSIRVKAHPQELDDYILQQQIAGNVVYLVNLLVSVQYTNSGNFEEAIEWIERATSGTYTPGSIASESETLFYSGNVYSELGNFDDAIIDFTQAIEIDTTNFESYYGRGSAYLEIKQYELAIHDFDKAIALNPQL